LRILKEYCIITFSARIGMSVFIEDCDPSLSELEGKIINELPGIRMKCQVVETTVAAVIGNLAKALFSLYQDDISIMQAITDALIPHLIDIVAHQGQKPTPKLLADSQIIYIKLYMVQDALFGYTTHFFFLRRLRAKPPNPPTMAM
jgi:hypothetical protein